jgi:hypothetical protein
VLFELPTILSDVEQLKILTGWLNQVRNVVGNLKGALPGEDFLARLEADLGEPSKGLNSRERRLQYCRMLLSLRRVIPLMSERSLKLKKKVRLLSSALSFAADELPDVSDERLLTAAAMLQKSSSTCKRASQALNRARRHAYDDSAKGVNTLYEAFRAVCADPEGAYLGGEDIPIAFKVIPGLGYDFVLNASAYLELERIVSSIVPVLTRAIVAAHRLQELAPAVHEQTVSEIVAQAFTEDEPLPTPEMLAEVPQLRDVLESYLVWHEEKGKSLLQAIKTASSDWRKYGRNPDYLWAVNVIVGAAQLHRSMKAVHEEAVQLLYGLSRRQYNAAANELFRRTATDEPLQLSLVPAQGLRRVVDFCRQAVRASEDRLTGVTFADEDGDTDSD